MLYILLYTYCKMMYGAYNIKLWTENLVGITLSILKPISKYLPWRINKTTKDSTWVPHSRAKNVVFKLRCTFTISSVFD